ncbi:mitochondrial carrier [Zopfia rhizophila CBS 207.26]|uniref:Mitochondrial carrier n=1 Tax=Zopfia rhizophila CBS 207.26 TaxID=1314779 RepID=A0A6A6EVP9_9PEZI|nr:mitochondrial carrier [Zopfia rhizophila CBS 207.26]
MSTKQSTVTPIQSILAGAAAGGIESLATYPTEYVKTRQQLVWGTNTAAQSPVRILFTTIRQYGVSRLYTGGAAFCISNASKSGVRFLTFDLVRSRLPKDSAGKVSVMGNLVSGIAAGVAESVAVVTPGETMKTKMIDDRAGPQMYRSTSHAIKTILMTEGPFGFYRGLLPVTLKQSANAMVRFTSYNYLSGILTPLLSAYGAGGSVSAIAGALAKVLTVYYTMLFDNIKTQLQSIEGKRIYSGPWECASKLVANGGLRMLWKGTAPRLVRLSVSGAITFSVYDQVVRWTAALSPAAAQPREWESNIL